MPRNRCPGSSAARRSDFVVGEFGAAVTCVDKDEARIAAQINHPNVAQVYDLGAENGFLGPPALGGRFTLEDGTVARPAFELMAERYLEPRFSADVVEDQTGVPADTIRRIAAELAHAAFEQEIELDVAWTDWAGRKHEKMIGRPVSMHAMRGISAHSNGFHTCRAIHLLQMLLGSIDCPGGFRSKAPFPRPSLGQKKWHARVADVARLRASGATARILWSGKAAANSCSPLPCNQYRPRRTCRIRLAPDRR